MRVSRDRHQVGAALRRRCVYDHRVLSVYPIDPTRCGRDTLINILFCLQADRPAVCMVSTPKVDWSRWIRAVSIDGHPHPTPAREDPAAPDAAAHRCSHRASLGVRHIDLMRRELDGEVEFVTLMWSDDVYSIKAFVGED